MLATLHSTSSTFSLLLSANIKPYGTWLFIFWDVARCNLIVVTNHNFISNFVLCRKLGLSHGGKNRLRVFENLVFKTVFRPRKEKVTVGWKKTTW